MARAAARRRTPAVPKRIVQECIGVGLLGACLLAVLALATYSPADPVFERVLVSNRAGIAGAAVAAVLFRAFGYASGILVLALGVIGGRLVLGRGLPGPTSRFWVSAVALLLSVSTLSPILQQASPFPFAGTEGGVLGAFLAEREQWLVGSWGALIGNVALAVVGVLSATGVSAAAVLHRLGLALGWLGAAAAAVAIGLWQLVGSGWAALRGGVVELGSGLRRGSRSLGIWRQRRARRLESSATLDLAADREAGTPLSVGASEAARGDVPARGPRHRRGDPMIVDHGVERSGVEGVQEAFSFSDEPSGPYQLPDISVFNRASEGSHTFDRDSLIMNSRILEKKLQDFGIGGRCVTVHPGPVITMYEFEPASGVKVNRIVSLADDLALALRALSVRIIAPLPGKSVVGIEVANPEREIVYLRAILESEPFRNEKSKLAIAIGKDIFGNPSHADLAKMPHLLVAGSTGTGKSVFLNALLCSLLCRTTPDDLRLLLIDPKLLELSVYGGIPHLIADVVTNPKRAAAALGGVVRKMDERYQMMAALGVRSIAQFNDRVDAELAAGNRTFNLKPKPGEEGDGNEVEYRRLPFIVVIIDELADLMVVSAKDVEESLQRLAQMARAAGIHLVLATQRPSVDVLTGIIKANFPARISFQVSSRTDSRTILDQNGADHLLGQGDMLYLPPGTSKLKRLHGAFVDEGEVEKLTAQLRAQGSPQFDAELTNVDEAEAGDEAEEEMDEMFDRAVAIVADTRNASISYLQRRLKVGYNRAARMIEQMERQGMVGPPEGTKPREVFLSSIQP